jgi:adenylate kinase family enzyme
MPDFIFVAGAPGSGKSTVAKQLQERLGSPCFEFGWIPEFRLPGPESQALEEALSFENLTLVVKNYIRHGYRNIIVTDLNDIRFREIPRRFARYRYVILTLVVTDDEVLRRRVLDETRSSGYRDEEAALRHNRLIQGRRLLPNEYRVDNTGQGIDETVGESLPLLWEADRCPDAYRSGRRLPPAHQFASYL